MPSSSPSLSLSDERAGPEDSTDGASCLCQEKEGHGERKLKGGRVQHHGSFCEKRALGDTELLNGRSRAKRKSSEIIGSNLDAQSLLALIPYSVLTGWAQQLFGEKMVLAACSLADAGAARPDAASC